MAQVSKRKSVRMNCIDVEQINLEMRLEQAKVPEIIELKQVEKKPVKKQLLKLINKARLNAKYPEQVIPIHRIERQKVYRDYGLR